MTQQYLPGFQEHARHQAIETIAEIRDRLDTALHAMNQREKYLMENPPDITLAGRNEYNPKQIFEEYRNRMAAFVQAQAKVREYEAMYKHCMHAMLDQDKEYKVLKLAYQAIYHKEYNPIKRLFDF